MTASGYPAARLPRAGVRPTLLEGIRSARLETWIVVGLVVVAAAIRIVTINNQSFWMDEALTAFEARSSFGGMLGTVLHVETTPPLYFVLAWVWGHLFGTGEVALRSISTLSGIALVPIAYLAGRDLISGWAGVLAAAFATVNPFMVWYSQEARAYMLLAAFSGASFLYFVRASRAPTRRNLAWWALWSALALTTHFFAAFVVAPEALWLLWQAGGRRRGAGADTAAGVGRTADIREVGAAVGVVALVELAMLPFAVLDRAHGASWIASVPRLNRISSTVLEWGVSILYRRAAVHEGLVFGAVLLAIVVFLLVVGADRRLRAGAAMAAAVAGFVFVVPLLLGWLGQDYFLSRNVIPGFVPLAVLVAAACVAPRLRLLGGALAIALLILFSVALVQVQTRAYLQRPNWRGVARSLGSARVPRAVLAADGTTADALKIYLPHVPWTQPPGRAVLIREVDVVGATKRLPLIVTQRAAAQPLTKAELRRNQIGSPVPRVRAPRGARLISRMRVYNWIVARFALLHPIRVTAARLSTLAPKFFLRTPRALLVFFQRPGR